MSLPRYAEYAASGVVWLGEVPSHWRIYPLKSVAAGPEGVFVDGDWIESRYISDGGIRYITTGNVGLGIYKEQGQGFISAETFNLLNCTEVFPGDVLISRLNSPIGRSCIIPDLGARIVTSVDNIIVRPTVEFDRRFLVFRLTSMDYFSETGNLASGATMQRIGRTALGNVRVAFPPIAEQISIAAFLDRETGKIDALIAEQEKLLTLLAEKRQATISHAVTRGLNPNAPMKDSGVPWLGEVPAHWDVDRLALLYRETAELGSDDLPILSVSIHEGVSDKELDDSELDRKVTRSEDRSKYKRVLPNDLTYNMMRAWQGGFGAVTVLGQVSPAYVVARPRFEIRTVFVEQLLRTPLAIEQVRRYSRGITEFRLRLYWEEFKNIRIALPPLAEQDEILSALACVTKKFDALSRETEIVIGLLKERRTALITAAVTGKIDVRNLAKIAA